jgi:putative N-acetyltransferase (TIGR04045 family)
MSDERYVLKVAETEEELQQYFAVRAATFVAEQGIFRESDVDEHDAAAIPIVAQELATGRIVGAVRCYQLNHGEWIGGRLAVIPAFRGILGPALIRKAVEIVCERGCQRFIAYIQKQNVRLFQRLGWRRTGETVLYSGNVHLVMEANLDGRSMPEAVEAFRAE